MDWQSTIFSVIDMRSFSNLWFWIMLAVTVGLLGVAYALRKISRITGVAFVIAYLVYVFQLVVA